MALHFVWKPWFCILLYSCAIVNNSHCGVSGFGSLFLLACFLAEQRTRMESELVSTEEVVNALLEYLVGPKLPLKSSALKEPPTLSQRQSVAKQVFFGFF